MPYFKTQGNAVIESASSPVIKSHEEFLVNQTVTEEALGEQVSLGARESSLEKRLGVNVDDEIIKCVVVSLTQSVLR